MQVLFERTLYKGNGHWTIQAVVDGPWRAEDYSASGAYLVISHTTKTEGGKVTKKLTEVKGKNIGRSNETTPHQQAVSEAMSRAEKQIGKGYVNDRLDAQTLPVTNKLGKKLPMLATKIEKINVDKVDWDHAFIQPKLDGERALNDEGLYSRGGVAMPLPHIQMDLDLHKSFEGLHTDGEMYIHGMPLNEIGSLVSKPRQESEQLEYWIYDIVSDKPFEERYADLKNAFAGAAAHLDPRIKLVPTYKVSNIEEAMRYHNLFLEQGFEGSMLRLGTDGYQDGKRSAKLVKIKPFEDAEFEVVGHNWATPNHAPCGKELLNPLFIYKVEHLGKAPVFGETLAPGTHEQKHEQGLNPEAKYGKFLTLTFMGWTKNGLPNIATAKCWREMV